MPRRPWTVALVFALVGSATTFAQDAVTLKVKFEKNKTFYEDMTTETKQEMTVMGMTINQTQKQTFYISWTPEQYNEKDKTWTVRQKIEGLKMDIQVGGNPVSYDSTKDAASQPGPLSDFFKALVGTEFKVVLGPEMNVVKIEGRDEFLKKLTAANQQMEPLLKQILSDEALKQITEPTFGWAPAKPVKKGDTWTRKSTLNMGPVGRYDTTHKYTFEGTEEKDKNLARVKVDTSLKYEPPTGAAAGGLPFRIVKAQLESKDDTGTIVFDIAKGRVSNSTMSMKLNGTLEIDISGMTSEVKLTQTQTQTLTTSDANPLKKAS